MRAESPRPSDGTFTLQNLGAERLLTIGRAEYRTYYSERVVRMLIERKGLDRAPLYFPFKETRGRHFLERLFRSLAPPGAPVPVPGRPWGARSPIAGGRLLLRTHHRIPERPAAGEGDPYFRRGRALRRDHAGQGRGAGAP